MEIRIGNRNISLNHPPFILAEMSGNHNQSLERAIKIVEEAAKCGADGIKLQTYTADTMTLDIKDGDFFINDPKSLWKGMSLYQLYKKAYTPWEWHRPIYDRCKELGILCFSTPFDLTAVDFLEDLDTPAYKIASFENTDHRLIKAIASLKKPLIISTGLASLSELAETVQVVKNSGLDQLILLKCTSSYPASPEDSNLKTIPHMRELFKCQIGLSDHTLGIGVPIASVALGATFIEKHFTLDRSDGGVDACFSLEPSELKALINETKKAWKSLGKIQYGISTKAEISSKIFRRSLYISKNLKKGDLFSKENLRAVRPDRGLPVKYLTTILGKRINQNAKKGTPLSFDLIG